MTDIELLAHAIDKVRFTVFVCFVLWLWLKN